MQSAVQGLFAIALIACTSPAPDGSRCASDPDCSSHACRGNLCAGGGCPCEEGWDCVTLLPGFLGPLYECQQQCGTGCPAQYGCFQDHCVYEGPTLSIEHMPLHLRAREPVQFTLVMTPEPPMTVFTWHRQSPN